MSKPIKVGVVVIVVIAFVTKKKIGPKTIHAHKTLFLKVLYPNKFESKKS